MNRYRLVLICIALLLLQACTENTDQLEHLGIQTGESKQNVFDSLEKNKNVSHVKPYARDFEELFSNEKALQDKLGRVLDHDGMVVKNDRSKLYMKLVFEDNILKDLYVAPANKNAASGIMEGMSKDDIKSILLTGLENGKFQHIFSMHSNSEWIDLENIEAKQKKILLESDTWHINTSDGLSKILLEFDGDKLVNIKKSSTPMELP